MTEPQKQISETPLVSAAPRRRGQNLLMLFMLACLTAIVTGMTLYWLDRNKPANDDHVTRWPRGMPDDLDGRPQADHAAALQKMQVLANALLQYREGPDGGGVRWPADLEVLQMAGLLEADWSNVGMLSGEPVVYQPDMPYLHDPERWVLCHDMEMGRRRNIQTGYRTIGPTAAAVILGDGSVKLLEGADLEKYGGLTTAVRR